jgi:hypothetical protein
MTTTDPRIAITGICLDCGIEIVRTEADPGDLVTIPAHDC